MKQFKQLIKQKNQVLKSKLENLINTLIVDTLSDKIIWNRQIRDGDIIYTADVLPLELRFRHMELLFLDGDNRLLITNKSKYLDSLYYAMQIQLSDYIMDAMEQRLETEL